ncbi:opsin, putative [Talaromyces stipitatus ATCC 10500]|uniref:Opsin, putative n=3 Tax=Talaromyces stipitatus (strain ATCC 10500 / CBS 375.48 / QM 6759 / NRRL 1006) TaxID=441959 RepID=B8M4A2_TALSN|nr:opsin, putative [Talaromyces stipitatus ATCC 10500]EED19097.1 opsin, putative [Talaromyces stipitatus ATCC 10500]
MIVPGMEEILKHTATLPTSTPTVGPIPTVIPGDWPVVQHIHDTGKRTLWVVVVLMAISALAFYTLAARVRVQSRLLHTLTALITTVSFLSYLAMATGEGVTYKHSIVHHPHKHVPDTHQEYLRQIFWVRYLNWIITTPLILINIALLGGLNGANLVVAISADLIMFAAGLTATFSHDERRWVWYTITIIAFLTVGFQVGVNGARSVRRGADQHRALFTSFAGANLLVFLLYPIILAASPLSQRISVDAETVAWAIHDILTQGIFGYWLLLGHDSSETGQLFVDGFWSNGINHEGAIRVGENDGV